MAEQFGYSPPETDLLTLRDLAIMLWAGVEKRRAAWRHTMTTAAAARNLGAFWSKRFRAKRPRDLMPWAFGGREASTFEEIGNTLNSLAA